MSHNSVPRGRGAPTRTRAWLPLSHDPCSPRCVMYDAVAVQMTSTILAEKKELEEVNEQLVSSPVLHGLRARLAVRGWCGLTDAVLITVNDLSPGS